MYHTNLLVFLQIHTVFYYVDANVFSVLWGTPLNWKHKCPCWLGVAAGIYSSGTQQMSLLAFVEHSWNTEM